MAAATPTPTGAKKMSKRRKRACQTREVHLFSVSESAINPSIYGMPIYFGARSGCLKDFDYGSGSPDRSSESIIIMETSRTTTSSRPSSLTPSSIMT